MYSLFAPIWILDFYRLHPFVASDGYLFIYLFFFFLLKPGGENLYFTLTINLDITAE